MALTDSQILLPLSVDCLAQILCRYAILSRGSQRLAKLTLQCGLPLIHQNVLDEAVIMHGQALLQLQEVADIP